MHRRLGNPIHIDHPGRTRMSIHPCAKTLRLKGFPTENHRLQLQLPTRPRLQRINSLQRIERRRRLAQHGHLFGDQQRQQVFWRPRHHLRHHHQPTTKQQRTPDLPHRIVKRQRMTLRPNLTRQTKLSIKRAQQPRHIPMSDRHTLRHTRCPRRINQIRNIISRRHRQPCTLLGATTDIVEIDDVHIAPGEAADQLRRRDRHDRFGISKHELNPRIRMHRIDRHIRRPRLQHRDNRNDRISGAGEEHCHSLARACAHSNQPVGQLIRCMVKFAITHRATLERHRRHLRRASHLRSEHLQNRHRRRRRLGQGRPITPLEQKVVLILIQKIHRRQPPRQIGGHDDASASLINRTTLAPR